MLHCCAYSFSMFPFIDVLILNASIMNDNQHTRQDVRLLETADIDQLANFQANKNRSYIQLHAGELNAQYVELNLGDVQIFREQLNVGSRIQAAPASRFLPFAVINSHDTDGTYCGKTRPKNSFIQATGGVWDINFSNHIDYICTAFNRESLTKNIRQLTEKDIPKNWLSSKAAVSDPLALKRYTFGSKKIMHMVRHNPGLLNYPSVSRVLNEAILQLTLEVLAPTNQIDEILRPQPQRIKGVHKVIEYLNYHAHQMPTLSELCAVAQLSERSLQYGFKEYLGMTPNRYLRIVRLNKVHSDLITASATKSKVVDFALKWGFLELGRFAGEYQTFFNELPSETLRKQI